MTRLRSQSITTNVAITLNAVLATLEGEQPKVLCVRTGDGDLGLPYGPFDPTRHRTFEIGMREWVERQTNVRLGYIEQLYTFGDKGREAPQAKLAGAANDRIVSVGYLALTQKPAEVLAQDAVWREWYSFFPWEDWRNKEPAILNESIAPSLEDWISKSPNKATRELRRSRVNIAFGLEGFAWEEERALDRYEMIYEAGLVTEAQRDRKADGLSALRTRTPAGQAMGTAMISDHRRILATAIGRVRGKLKYRPILFEITPSEFTLLQLQRIAEAIVGFEFHKQNFRRSVEKSGFVTRSGKFTQQAGGRPAALFRVDRDGLRMRAASGLALPRLRRATD